MKNLFYCLAIFSLVFLAGGCDNGQVNLGGTVTYLDTGEPLECGTVNFTTDSFQARGDIRAGGKYTAGSYKENDGLPPGTYKVYISGAQREEGQDKGGMPVYVPLIDSKFENASTSGLELTVDAKTKTFDIKVDRAKKK